MTNAPLRIIQLTDTHLLADPTHRLLGVNTEESFQAIVDYLHTSAGKIDLIIHSGDLSQDGSEASYLRLAKALQDFHVPIYYVPGNHDHVKVMNSIYPLNNLSAHKHVVMKNWHIILLNSQQPGEVYGNLDASELAYLKHCLEAYPEHHAIIVFHHQPVLQGSAWLDQLGLKNAEAFWDIVTNFPKVNTVLYGHVHQENVQMFKGIKCFGTPSTCIQFKRHQDQFGLENLPQGFRWLHLYEDGFIDTAIQRLPTYIGNFDEEAKGY